MIISLSMFHQKIKDLVIILGVPNQIIIWLHGYLLQRGVHVTILFQLFLVELWRSIAN